MCLDEVAGDEVYDVIVSRRQVAYIQVHVALAEDQIGDQVFVVAPSRICLDDPLDSGVLRSSVQGG
jgi:hypothetical protein